MSAEASEQRKKHVEELRKTHFHLGFEKNTNFTSTAKDPVIYQKKGEKNATNQLNQEPQLNHHEIKKQFHKNNYQLGIDNAHNMYESIHEASFKTPINGERVRLSEETKSDLRKHHFQFGYHSVENPTEYKQNYIRNSNCPIQLDKINKETLRQHNHDFGDKNSYFTTMYDQMHNKQYDPALLTQARDNQSTKAQILEIRKTNLIMGRDKPIYTSQQHTIHNTKPIVNNQYDIQQIKSLTKNSHIEIGTDNPFLISEAKLQFQGKQPLSRTIVPESTKKDLRSTHFVMGNDKIPYQTENQINYKELGNEHKEVRNPMLQKSHFTIEQIYKLPTEQHYKSAYNHDYMSKLDKMITSEQVRNDRADRASKLIFGTDVDAERFISEQAKNYREYKGVQTTKISQKTKEDFRAHHYNFGEDNDVLQSHHQQTYVNKSQSPAKLSEEMQKDLRARHFHLGFGKQDYYTHHSEIGSKQGPPNKLDPEVALKIRAHAAQLN